MPPSLVRRLFLVAAVVLTVSVACKKEEPFVPVVTTIVVSPNSKAFHAISATQQLTAAVQDQRGQPMTSAGLVWSTNASGVATVSGTGLVTAAGGGSATITATIGTVSGTASVTVTQIAASLFKFDGDAQSGPVGQQLPIPVIARVLDSASFPMPGVSVSFAPLNGGSVGTPTSTTNASGQVSSTWTLGNGVGAQQLSASSAGIPSVNFGATALALGADTVIKNSTDPSNVPAGTSASPAPAVLVKDNLGNPVSGVAVTFAITSGGGQVSGASQFTNASGIATVSSWIVGTTGTQTMTATVTGAGIGGNPISFNATVLSPGAPATVTVFAGGNQQGLIGYPVNVKPAALVRDASGNPVQNVTVTFAVQSGGGSVSAPTTPATGLTGVATVGNWTILAGANSVTATVGGVATPATFNATGVASTYNITLRYITTPTAAQQQAFDSAAARWSRIIIGDLTDVPVNTGTAQVCGRSDIPQINETIDDVIIFVILEPIDGVGQILGSAGPCALRTTGGMPLWGIMRFDTADLTNMENNGTLRPVILHEMSHVLGLGTVWQSRGLLTGAGGSDPFFTGAQARSAFDQVGGTGYSLGGKVPVENTGGAGTRDGHWRESVFDNEVCTGFIDAGANPLSIVTAAQFIDLTYQVNLGDADPYTLPGPLSARAASGVQVHLVNDIYRGPIMMIDGAGRITSIVQPRQ